MFLTTFITLIVKSHVSHPTRREVLDIYVYMCMLVYRTRESEMCIHTFLCYVYIYICVCVFFFFRKTKTGHIRIINLFPSCYGYWYESITPKITEFFSNLTDKIITLRINSGRMEGWRVSSQFRPLLVFFNFLIFYHRLESQ